MLRISIDERPDTVTIKLEGRISGPWTGEFARAWENLKPSLDGRRLLVDLSGLDFVDPGGAHLLEEIYQETFADFVADSPLAKYFAEQARRRSNRHRKGI